VIRRERAKCAGLPSEEREKGPNRAVGEKPNQRLCDAQAAGARPAPDVATFTEVTRPSTVEASTYRLRFGEPQVMAVMSAIAGVRPPARRLRQPHPGTARRRLARSALPQSAGHLQPDLQPASAQTQGPHRSAIGTAPLPTHTTGRLAVLFTNTYGRLRGPALPRLTHAYLRNWFDEARWPSPGANSTAH
jgi:hypothetical protein